MHTSSPEEVRDALRAVKGVKNARMWEKHGKQRIYLDLDTHAALGCTNSTLRDTIFFDFHDMMIHCKGNWISRESRTHAQYVLQKIAAKIGIEYMFKPQ